MDRSNWFENELKTIVASDGLKIFDAPEALCGRLVREGAGEPAARSLELALIACPSFKEAALNADLNAADAGAIIAAVAESAGFSLDRAREIVSRTAAALGNTEMESARARIRMRAEKTGIGGSKVRDFFSRAENSAGKGERIPAVSPAAQDENKKLKEDVLAIRNSGDGFDEALAELETMADAGNARAAYELGQYSRNAGQKEAAKTWYEWAAVLGWGPAFGALSSMELEAEKPDMKRAVLLGTRPDACLGRDGSEWVHQATELTAYRHENAKRAVMFIILAAITVMVSFIAAASAGAAGIIAALLSVALFLGALYAKIADRYGMYRALFFLADAVWVLIALSMLV